MCLENNVSTVVYRTYEELKLNTLQYCSNLHNTTTLYRTYEELKHYPVVMNTNCNGLHELRSKMEQCIHIFYKNLCKKIVQVLICAWTFFVPIYRRFIENVRKL